jgi:PKD repeat protein
MRRLFTVSVCLALLAMALLCTVSPVTAGHAGETYPYVRDASYPNGTPWTIGQSLGIAINGTGYTFVSEFTPPRIRVFDPAGEQVRSWDGPPGSVFSGIAVSSDRVYVAGYMTNQLLIYTLQGTFVNTVGAFSFPWGVAVNSTGHVFVACNGANQVRVFEPDGTAAGTIGAGLDQPLGIAIDGSDRLYVTEHTTPSRVAILDRDGTHLGSYPVQGGHPYGCALNTTGTLLVTDYSAGLFYGYTSSGTIVGQSQAGILSNPRAIAVNSAGEAYVVSDSSGKVSIFRVDPVRPTPTPSGPSGSFAAYPESGTAPLTVQFLDYSANGKSWAWEFGDGGVSDQQYPVHVYNQSGLYTVSVTVTDWSGQTVTTTKDHLIRVTPPPSPAPTPVGGFSANATAGPAPMTVAFTDTSSPAPSHRWWQFGDGESSTDANPVHTYERTGAFTVNLTVWTGIGQATVSKPAYIVVDRDPRVPEASFTLSRTTGPAPLYVRFTDTSTGNPTSWRWDFGGGAWTAKQHAAVIYWQPGTYPVTLTVRNAYGWSSMGTNVTVAGGLPMSGKGDAVRIVG